MVEPASERRTRLSLGFLDQILSSVSNVLIVVAVARIATVAEFGALALTFAAVTGVVAFNRGLLGTPLVLLSRNSEAMRTEVRFATTSAAVIGMASGLTIALSGFLFDAPLGVFMLAIAVPLIAVQDLSRYYCVAVGLPSRAIKSDGFWTVGSLVLLLLTVVIPSEIDSGVVLGLWTGVVAVSVLILMLPLGIIPQVKGFWLWSSTRLADRLRFGADSALGATSSLVVAVFAGAVVGPEAIAAIRGAGSVMGPLNLVFSASTLILIPELSRGVKRDVRQVWRPLRKVSIAMSVIALSIGVTSIFVPLSVGEMLLGQSWSFVQPLLPITAVEYVALAWLASAQVALKTLKRSKSVLKARLVQTTAYLGLSIAAAILFQSAIAIALALALATMVASLYAKHLVIPIAKPRNRRD